MADAGARTLWVGVWMAAGCFSGPDPAGDRAAVTAVLDAQVVAWNQGDLDAFAATYWDAPALVFTSGGKIRRGYAEMLAGYRKNYPDRTAMGTLALTDLEVTPLGADAAWVLGRWALRHGGAADPDAQGVFTLVCRRIGGAWRIVHDHTSLLAPPAPAAPAAADAQTPAGTR